MQRYMKKSIRTKNRFDFSLREREEAVARLHVAVGNSGGRHHDDDSSEHTPSS